MTKYEYDPHYPLEKCLFRLAQVAGPNKAEEVAYILGYGAATAEAYCHRHLQLLTHVHYCHSVELDFADGPVWGDVYGYENQDGRWYIKFYVEHGRVYLTSFHRPKENLTRLDGYVVQAQARVKAQKP